MWLGKGIVSLISFPSEAKHSRAINWIVGQFCRKKLVASW